MRTGSTKALTRKSLIFGQLPESAEGGKCCPRLVHPPGDVRGVPGALSPGSDRLGRNLQGRHQQSVEQGSL